MSEFKVLKKSKVLFDVNNCIICNKGGDLTSTDNGRRNLVSAAYIRKDVVYERLLTVPLESSINYHMNNECYKNYVHKRTLNRIKVC